MLSETVNINTVNEQDAQTKAFFESPQKTGEPDVVSTSHAIFVLDAAKARHEIDAEYVSAFIATLQVLNFHPFNDFFLDSILNSTTCF